MTDPRDAAKPSEQEHQEVGVAERRRSGCAVAAEVAHKLRTQLAILSLQIGAIDGALARQAEDDVRALAELVDELSLAIADVGGETG